MKKIIILIAFITIGLNAISQVTEYNKWAISADFGTSVVADESARFTDYGVSFGLHVRYSTNDKIGIGLSGGYDNIDVKTFGFVNTILAPKDVNIKYSRINGEIYINAFNMVDLYSDKLTVLFHGGPGLSFINTDNIYPLYEFDENGKLIDIIPGDEEYSEYVANLRGGITLLVNLTPRIALKGDISATSNYDASRTIDGQFPVSVAGVHSMIYNTSIGLTVRLGKNKRHYDDYVIPVIPVINNYQSDTTLINNHYVTYYSIINSMVDTTQNVFFDNDEYIIRDSELNAIFKTYINLDDNDKYTLTIRGFASPSEDETLPVDSDDYNMTLSENRANVLKIKFLDMGISESRITVKFYGKDKSLPKENVHDAARRVELIISTNK